MVKAVIIEDNQIIQQIIIGYLEQCFPEIHISGSRADVHSAVELVSSTWPDLVFVDIELRTGTGFDMLDRLLRNGRQLPEIIFITAHGKFEFATKAFKYSAVDFISKPIEQEEFQKAVDRALKRIRSHQGKGATMVIHRSKGVQHFVEVDKITHLKAEGCITRFFLADGDSFTAMRNLGYYAPALLKHPSFFRISNSTIVNRDYLATYIPGKPTLTLSTGAVVTASRRGGQRLRRALSQQASPFHQTRSLNDSGPEKAEHFHLLPKPTSCSEPLGCQLAAGFPLHA